MAHDAGAAGERFPPRLTLCVADYEDRLRPEKRSRRRRSDDPDLKRW